MMFVKYLTSLTHRFGKRGGVVGLDSTLKKKKKRKKRRKKKKKKKKKDRLYFYYWNE